MGKFLKLITNDFMTGVSEHWCNNQGVAVLPFVYQYNQYWFLLINENNPLFKDKKISNFSTLTGGYQLNNGLLPTCTCGGNNETEWIQQCFSNRTAMSCIYSKVESNKMYQGVFLLIWILMI